MTAKILVAYDRCHLHEMLQVNRVGSSSYIAFRRGWENDSDPVFSLITRTSMATESAVVPRPEASCTRNRTAGILLPNRLRKRMLR